MKVRCIILGFCLWFWAPPVHAQTGNDHEIPEVVIRSHIFAGNAFTTRGFAYPICAYNAYANAGELLTMAGPVTVKDYGSGASSTTSIRGGSAGHTQIVWEEIPLNSPALGLTDLSLVSGQGLQSLHYLQGPATLRYGTGGLGGGLHLGISRGYRWMPNAVALGYGSFGDKFIMANAGKQTKRLRYRGMVDFHSAKNNYPYHDYFQAGNPLYRRESAAWGRLSTEQYLSVQCKPDLYLSAQVWAGGAERELPPALGSMDAGESQSDRFVRSKVSLKKFTANKWRADVYTAHLYDLLHYRNDSSGIDSESQTHRLTGGVKLDREFYYKGEVRRKVPHTLLFGLRGEQQWAKGDGLSESAGRNLITGQAEWQSAWNAQGPETRMLLRQDLVDGKVMPLAGAMGLTQSLGLRQEKLYPELRGEINLWRDYRMPTLNDLYWNPGGNAELQPEKMSAGEAEIRLRSKHEKEGKYAFEDILRLGVFYKDVRNWILWLPSSNSNIWTPENVLRVRARGLELSWEMYWERYKDVIRMGIDLQYTEAVATEVGPGQEAGLGRQLIYTPRYQGRGFVGYDFGRTYTLLLSASYTGRRYILRDHSEYLPGYALLNAGISRHIRLKEQRFTLGIDARNLTGVQYESVARRPMRGRSFMLRLSWDGKW